MASEETLQAITDLLTSLNKDWEQDFLPLCSNIFKRDIFGHHSSPKKKRRKALASFRKKRRWQHDTRNYPRANWH